MDFEIEIRKLRNRKIWSQNKNFGYHHFYQFNFVTESIAGWYGSDTKHCAANQSKRRKSRWSSFNVAQKHSCGLYRPWGRKFEIQRFQTFFYFFYLFYRLHNNTLKLSVMFSARLLIKSWHTTLAAVSKACWTIMEPMRNWNRANAEICTENKFDWKSLNFRSIKFQYRLIILRSSKIK